MNIPDEIMNNAAKEMADDIDWELMSSLMTQTGWTKITVDFGPRMTESTAHEIKEWTRSQCKGYVQSRKKDWLFQNAEDATLFTLRWA